MTERQMCQRCKQKPATGGSHQVCITTTPGVTHERHFHLCSECQAGLSAHREDIDQWWPTNKIDSPVAAVTKPDTIEQRWLDMKDFVDGMEPILNGTVVVNNPENLAGLAGAMRMHAVMLVLDARRLNGALPADADAFVRRHLGAEPWPTLRDVMIQNHPEMREHIEQMALDG